MTKKRLHWSLSIANDSLHHVDIMSKGKKHLTSSETQNQNHSLTYTRAHTNGTKIHDVSISVTMTKRRLHWSLSIAHDSLHHVEIMSKGKKNLSCGEVK